MRNKNSNKELFYMRENQLPPSEIRGWVYNIQRYNLHDGPGIRTIIFLKGCPLRCPWCANPESQSFEPEMMGDEMIGYEITAKEAVDRAARDIAFFKRSGGGITLSGGEVVAQPDFSQAIVAEAKRRGIHITLETACCTSWETFIRVAENADVVLADIKTMDEQHHLKMVGISNFQILDNIKRYSALGKEIIVRIPVIPGFNDGPKNLWQTAAFCKVAGIREINLLPYHEMGVNKYKKLKKNYQLSGTRPPSKERLEGVASQLGQEFGIDVKVL